MTPPAPVLTFGNVTDSVVGAISPVEMSDEKFEALVDRLNAMSVAPGKHFDAYLDISWDEPDFAIDPSDARFELGRHDPLGATSWYQGLPQPTRARLGLHLVASKMRTGLQFEQVLQRGLLEYAGTLPNGSNEYRYVMHEVIEESQHSLMFQEFVNRTGIDVAGMPWWARLATRFIVPMGTWFPELFMTFVIGGEDPIDYTQRKALRESDQDIHPLLERVMQIHVTEEARHLSFARHFLKNRVPALGRVKRAWLSVATPRILGEMSGLMIQPSRDVVREYGIPADVVTEAYVDNPSARNDAIAAMRKIRTLNRDLGLMNPVARTIWKRKKIYADD